MQKDLVQKIRANWFHGICECEPKLAIIKQDVYGGITVRVIIKQDVHGGITVNSCL